MKFADNLHVSKFLLLNRYGKGWLPKESPLGDYTFGAFLSSVVSVQGFCDPPLPQIGAEGRGLWG